MSEAIKKAHKKFKEDPEKVASRRKNMSEAQKKIATKKIATWKKRQREEASAVKDEVPAEAEVLLAAFRKTLKEVTDAQPGLVRKNLTDIAALCFIDGLSLTQQVDCFIACVLDSLEMLVGPVAKIPAPLLAFQLYLKGKYENEDKKDIKDLFNFEELLGFSKVSNEYAAPGYKTKAEKEKVLRAAHNGWSFPKSLGDISECRKDMWKCSAGSSKLVAQIFVNALVCIVPCVVLPSGSSGESKIWKELCTDESLSGEAKLKKMLQFSRGLMLLIDSHSKNAGGLKEEGAPLAYLFRKEEFEKFEERVRKFSQECKAAQAQEKPLPDLPDELNVRKVQGNQRMPRVMGDHLTYYHPYFNDTHAQFLRFKLGDQANSRRVLHHTLDDYAARRQLQKKRNKSYWKRKKKERLKEAETEATSGGAGEEELDPKRRKLCSQ
jgi:hypothetical protein